MQPTFYYCYCNLQTQDRHSEAGAELFAPGRGEDDVESMREHAMKHRGYYSRLVITPITNEKSPDGHPSYPIVVVGSATHTKPTQSAIQAMSMRVVEALQRQNKITLRQVEREPAKRFEVDITSYAGGIQESEWSARHSKWLQEMILLALSDGDRHCFDEVEATVLKPSDGDREPLRAFQVAVATLMARDKVVMTAEGTESVYLQLPAKKRLDNVRK